MEFSKKIGAKLKEQRKLKGESLRTLADKIGVTSSLVARWERGCTGITVTTIEKYCAALNISPEIVFKDK